MKNLSELNLHPLSMDEQVTINGGSEFSEDIARSVGWLFGAIYALSQEYYIKSQADNFARM